MRGVVGVALVELRHAVRQDDARRHAAQGDERRTHRFRGRGARHRRQQARVGVPQLTDLAEDSQILTTSV